MANSSRQIFTNLLTVYRPLINELNTRLAKYDLFNSQWGIIRLLKNQAPLSFQEIAKATYIEKPSASSLIHKLIVLGYVEIMESSDKRIKLVCLTSTGEQVYEEIDNLINVWVTSLFEGISIENQAIVAQSLEILKTNLLD